MLVARIVEGECLAQGGDRLVAAGLRPAVGIEIGMQAAADSAVDSTGLKARAHCRGSLRGRSLSWWEFRQPSDLLWLQDLAIHNPELKRRPVLMLLGKV